MTDDLDNTDSPLLEDDIEMLMAQVKTVLGKEFEHVGLSVSSLMAKRGVTGGVTLGTEFDAPAAFSRRAVAEETDASSTPPVAEAIEQSQDHRYEIGDLVAKGGMGAILKARDVNCRRNVAMKVMLDGANVSDAHLVRFIEEAQVTAQLEHPNIVPVHELGVDSTGNVFYTMKLVKGRTLKDILKAIKERDEVTILDYPLNRLLNIFRRTCDAIAYAHSKEVIHRDLKPENIMVGDFGEVQVMDWGLAKILGKKDAVSVPESGSNDAKPDRSLGESSGVSGWVDENIESLRQDSDSGHMRTLDGQIMGTPQFMAPEQADGKIEELDARTDIYALGGILYTILVLRPPVVGRNLQDILMKVAKGEIINPSVHSATSVKANKLQDGDQAQAKQDAVLRHCPELQVPQSLAAVAMKALTLSPDDRYQSVADLQNEVDAYQGGFATEAERASAMQQIKLLIGRHKSEFLLFAAAVVLALVGAAFAFWRVNIEKTVAEKNAALAQENATEATRARVESERNLVIAERSNYISRINLAQANIRNGNYDAARAILAACPEQFRHFEWDRLNLLTDIGDQLFRGHRQPLDSVNFSRDGSKILTSGKDGTAKLWNAKSGRVIMTFRDEYRIRIRSAAISPDGTRVVTANYDSIVKLWDTATGKEIRSFEEQRESAEVVVFSPDGNRVAAGGVDGIVRIWDRETGTLKRTIGTRMSVAGLAFSPDGTRMMTSGPMSTRMWNIASGKPEVSLAVKDSFSAAIRPNGKQIVTTGGKSATLWDIASQKVVHNFVTSTRLYLTAFSPDGKKILTGSDRETVLWDVASGQRLHTIKTEPTDRCSLAFSPDGKTFLTGGETAAILWDVATGEELRRYDGWLKGKDLEELEVRKVMTLSDHGSWVWTVNFSPDGQYLTSGAADKFARIWARKTGRRVRQLGERDSSYIRVAVFSPDNRKFLTADHHNSAQLWSTDNFVELHRLEGHKGGIHSGVFGPDGDVVLTGSGDRSAKLWDVSNGRILKTFIHSGRVSTVAFSPDGQKILTGSFDKTAILWDRVSGEALHTFTPGGAVYSVAFSPDGKEIVIGTSHPLVKIWEPKTGALLRSLKGHSMTVSAVTFSPDGKRILTGSHDRTAKLWDRETGRELISFEGHTDTITGVAISPDGKQIATSSADRTVKVWNSE